MMQMLQTLDADDVYVAYSEGISHASDTMDREKRNVSCMEKVKSVYGEGVYADSQIVGCRKWIEQKSQNIQRLIFTIFLIVGQ